MPNDPEPENKSKTMLLSKLVFSFLGFGKERNSSTLSNESDFEVTITEKNNKSYVRARPTNDNIEEAEELLSKINEALS